LPADGRAERGHRPAAAPTGHGGAPRPDLAAYLVRPGAKHLRPFPAGRSRRSSKDAQSKAMNTRCCRRHVCMSWARAASPFVWRVEMAAGRGCGRRRQCQSSPPSRAVPERGEREGRCAFALSGDKHRPDRRARGAWMKAGKGRGARATASLTEDPPRSYSPSNHPASPSDPTDLDDRPAHSTLLRPRPRVAHSKAGNPSLAAPGPPSQRLLASPRPPCSLAPRLASAGSVSTANLLLRKTTRPTDPSRSAKDRARARE
jgi:hypothetical protein